MRSFTALTTPRTAFSVADHGDTAVSTMSTMRSHSTNRGLDSVNHPGQPRREFIECAQCVVQMLQGDLDGPQAVVQARQRRPQLGQHGFKLTDGDVGVECGLSQGLQPLPLGAGAAGFVCDDAHYDDLWNPWN